MYPEMEKDSDCGSRLSLHILVYAAPGVFATERPRNPGCSVSPAMGSAFLCTHILTPEPPDCRPDDEPPSLQGQGEANEDNHTYLCSMLEGIRKKAPLQRCVLQGSPGLQEGTRDVCGQFIFLTKSLPHKSFTARI